MREGLRFPSLLFAQRLPPEAPTVSHSPPAPPVASLPASVGTKPATIILEQEAVTLHFQDDLLDDRLIFKLSLESRLFPFLAGATSENFRRCGREKLYRTCEECGRVEELPYHCNLRWCPLCNWRIANERGKLTTAWAKRVHQAKHLVLTEANHPVLTRSLLRDHVRRLQAMRRSKCLRGCRGGCISVEVTNEGRGWHLHSHWLIDSDWVEPGEVSRRWGRLCGQTYAIVCVRDARSRDYQEQVSKYVVKPSQMAGWPPEVALEFILAIRGRRFFFTFGSLSRCRAEVMRELARERHLPECECGSTAFKYESELSRVLWEIRHLRPSRKNSN
jgi:hypothetical protein